MRMFLVGVWSLACLFLSGCASDWNKKPYANVKSDNGDTLEYWGTKYGIVKKVTRLPSSYGSTNSVAGFIEVTFTDEKGKTFTRVAFPSPTAPPLKVGDKVFVYLIYMCTDSGGGQCVRLVTKIDN